jgi:transposase-like protein
MTNQDEKENLTPAQIQAVNLLAVGESITGAAEQLKVARQTISTWVNQNTNFQQALREKQSENFGDELRRVKGLTGVALAVIREGLEHENYRVRLTSAVKLLSAVNISKLIADADKPPPIIIPPAIHSDLCPECGEKSFNAFLAEM